MTTVFGISRSATSPQEKLARVTTQQSFDGDAILIT